MDGVERQSSVWKSQCAYVEQDDLLFENLVKGPREKIKKSSEDNEPEGRVVNFLIFFE